MAAHSFDSFSFIHHLPVEVLAGLDHVVVNQIDCETLAWGGVHGEYAAKRLADAGVADLSEWEVIGSKYVDHSGFCPVEGKMEYYGEDLRLLVRKSDLRDASRAFFSKGSTLTYNPFAAALGA